MLQCPLSFTLQAAFFNWTVSMESAIDTSFFYGYLITQVPGNS